MAQLRIPQSRRIAIFRMIERRLRADPILRETVRTWRSWSGDAEDAVPFSLVQAPWIRLSIASGPQSFWAVSTMRGTLVINVEMAVAGTCIDDLDGLWALVERACYSADATERLEFQRQLLATPQRAHTGLIQFDQPAFEVAPERTHVFGIGRLSIEYHFDVNPTTPGY